MSNLEHSLAAQVQGVPFGAKPGFSGTGCPIWSKAWLFRYRVPHLEQSLTSQVHGVMFRSYALEPKTELAGGDCLDLGRLLYNLYNLFIIQTAT